MDIGNIKELIKNIEDYEAHVCKYEDEEGKERVKRESLLDHTRLTEQYFRYIWKEKDMDGMIERYGKQIWPNRTEEAHKFWMDMIIGIPLFHDLGKINPEFQARKLKNDKVEKEFIFSSIAGRHSLISSILYMEYFQKELKKSALDKNDKKMLRRFIILHAYIIERHHSDLGDFVRFLEAMEIGSGEDIIEVFSSGICKAWAGEFVLDGRKMSARLNGFRKQLEEECPEMDSIGIYIYVKMLYSMLIASDYYATAEFMSGVRIRQTGNLNEISEWMDIYENTDLMKTIREYQRKQYPLPVDTLRAETNMNVLRTEILCETEKVLKDNLDENLFYLEAPTGSGKSNTAMNLSFQMMKEDKSLRKIYYIYPFNTLVEQNMSNLRKIFGDCPDIFQNIAVVNSLTPIKVTQQEKRREEVSEQTMYYQRALLDRQFLNYPMIISTHVSLFDMMFGDTKESAFGLHQLMNSVIVLDEIQSYKNTIWGEIIYFLKEFSYMLHIKVIIMSATLPNLDLLSENVYQAVRLMPDPDKYFSNPCFKQRVEVSYELLDKEDVLEDLFRHVKEMAQQKKKILVEFIKKKSAYNFFVRLIQDTDIECDIEYMSGDDSLVERSRILDKISGAKGSIILVSTQVIEAGVDIDMDIGYKNISKLDSEEQFLGRINRSCMREGKAFFFKLDEGAQIYKGDVRIGNMFTLENREMEEILVSKNFYEYYRRILEVLKRMNLQIGESGLEEFFAHDVRKMYWSKVKERMELIAEDQWSMSVYLARTLKGEDDEVIDGKELWKRYVDLLNDFKMDYAEKRIRLSQVTSKMNYFIYQIKKNYDLIYDDKVGEIFYIADGEKYFEEGKLNREKIQGEIGEFVDFI